jgi:Zn-dependent peptidase ImmA (M78 family)/DNA-binding XRE family transcriptional regulator
MSEKAHITPAVITWARKSAKLSLTEAAMKIPVDATKLEAWENGDEFPTVKQAEKLAKSYRRPLAVLFLPEVPKDFQTLQDFRSRKPKDFSTALVFIMREVQEKQAWMREVLIENQESKLNIIGKFNVSTAKVEDVANSIRQNLEVVTGEWGNNPLKYWISKAEAKRIFISMSSFYHTRLKIDPDEVSGFAIADVFAPFIFLNSGDYENAQLFTLVHEISHLWIKESGISNDTGIEFRDKTKFDPIESFCNAVAANVLLPTNEFIQKFKSHSNPTYENITSVAKHFGVSNFALIIRALNLGLISVDQYNTFKKEADKRFQEFQKKEAKLKEEQESGPNYHLLQMRRNGRAFSQIVLDFYKGGHITGVEASNLLNVKINNFPKFEYYVYR